MAVRSVQQTDVERFLKDVAGGKTAVDQKTKPRGRSRVRGGKGAATRTVGLLGAIFSYAQKLRIRADNPVRGVKRFEDRRMERFLTPNELRRLGAGIEAARAAGENSAALAIITLLALTGCRKSEILTLRWSDVRWEAACLVLGDSKTGYKTVPLGTPALRLLSQMRAGGAKGYVFSGREDEHFKGLQKVWERVRARADLSDVRLHDLRHTYVSAGASDGVGLTVIGRVVGHRSTATTARYAHFARDVVHDAADRVSTLVAQSLLSEEPCEVAQLTIDAA